MDRELLAAYQRWNLVILSMGSIACGLIFSFREGWSVALGGIVSAANFWLTVQVVRRIFVPAGEMKQPGLALLAVFLKYGLLFGAVGLLLWQLRPEGAGFAGGFCSILVAITAKSVSQMIHGTDREDERA